MIEISHPTGIIEGRILIEGSKSIANRAILLSNLYAPTTELIGKPSANDTKLMLNALALVGKANSEDITEIDVEDAGTVCRFILPVLAFSKGEFILKGTARMAARPLSDLIDVLRDLGASIEGDGLPLIIHGQIPEKRDLVNIRIDTSTSSQFASALLMCLPLVANNAEMILNGGRLSLPYIDMTIQIMKQIGFNVERNGAFVTYKRSPMKAGIRIQIEPDYSSVAYWVGIIALSKGGELQMNTSDYLNSIQGDSKVIQRAIRNGLIKIRTEGHNLYMTRDNKSNSLKRVRLDFTDTPDLAIPELIMYTAKNFVCHFCGIESLDYKESPRFKALEERLGLFGIGIKKSDNGFITMGEFKHPKKVLTIDPLQDHRMVMGFAMTGILNPIRIISPNVVSKSYPGFWDDLRKVNFDLNKIE